MSLTELRDPPGDRLLLVGSSGAGKSSLAHQLAGRWPSFTCLWADPGNPAFGPPAALSIARMRDDGWEVVDVEPLGTLDAQRFRSPLCRAAARLLARNDCAQLLVDVPGVTRGVGAAELVAGICDVTRPDVVLVVGDRGDALDLVVGVEVLEVDRKPDARRGGKAARRSRRTRRWDAWLVEPTRTTVASLELFDHHPKCGLEGRIAVLEGAGGPVGLGVVSDGEVRWRRTRAGEPLQLTLRDAVRRDEGVRTVSRTSPMPDEEAEPLEFTLGGKPAVTIGLPMERVASARLSPVGDWFDDPMWLLRLDHRRRCLAFDLGEVGRLPTRVVHEISDAFVSHAHLDHVRDFMWLIRKRLGERGAMRMYGPPGFSDRVHHMIEACTWDRVEDRGPCFEVGELHGDELRWTALQVGEDHAREALRVDAVTDDVILRDDRFLVRAIELDHHLPVLAFSVEESARFDVRPDVLRERGWTPGAWLGELKRLASRGELDAVVEVPGSGGVPARELAESLLIERRAERFVYATDLADHPSNRARLIEFARDADVFVCEAAFREHDRDQAERTGHLTARACGEIATAANVRWLVPFHPSSRYHEDWRELLAEVRDSCDRVVSGFEQRRQRHS